MPYKNPPKTKLNDKFLGFCAVTPNKKFMKLFERAGVQNVLVSFHYIQKNKALAKDFLEQVRGMGGVFMTDSGAFSFLNDKSFDPRRFDWDTYVQEYAEWLDDNKDYIFSACNLDVDLFVGPDRVRKWNEIYFEKLNEDINSIYVAHQNVFGRGNLDAFKDYCKQYDYVAVNERLKNEVSSIYQTAKLTKTCIHGLAWTKPTLLDDNPFFSVDSSTWVNYQKYGATPIFDGTNFKQYDKDDKSIRTTQKMKCEHYGVKFYEFCHEVDEGTTKHNDDEGLTFSLRTWLDTFQHIKKFARTKLSIKLEDKLQGKKTVFIEDTTADPTAPKRPSKILGALENSGVSNTDAIPTTYTIGEDGSEVALYEKRPKKIAIQEFITNTGDVLVCNYCHIADKCPQFKDDNECAFDFRADEATKDPLSAIEHLIKLQTERLNRAMMIEKMEGGNINKVYSQEFRTLEQLNRSKMDILIQIQNRGINVNKVIVEHTGNVPDGVHNIQAEESDGFKSLLLGLMQK